VLLHYLGKQETGKLRLFAQMLHAFTKITRNTVKNITWLEKNTQKDRVGAPDRTYEGSIASCCVLRTCSVLAKSVTVLVAV